MINIVLGYLLVSFLFLVRCMLLMQDDIAILESTRSRELKATSKKMLERKKESLVLCLVWPLQIVKAAKDIFLYYKIEK